MSKDLEKIYSEVIGGPALDMPSDTASSGDKGEPKGVDDKAYKQPKYDGTEGDRDPREDFLKDEDELEEEEDSGLEDEEGDKKTKESSKSEDSEDDYEAIPDHLIEAGRLSGLSDDEIVKLAEEQPQVLEKLAKNFAEMRFDSKSEKVQKEEDKKAEAKKEEPLPDFEIDEDDMDEHTLKMAKYLKSVVPSLTKKIETLEGQLKAQGQDLGGVKEIARAEAIRRIDGYFDQRIEDLPSLGNTKNLTESQKQARIACHGTAVMLQKGSDGKISDEQALNMAIAMYRGQISDSKSKAKIISDLSNRKQKFMARPSHGKRPLLDRQKGKSSEEERALSVIEEKLSTFS